MRTKPVVVAAAAAFALTATIPVYAARTYKATQLDQMIKAHNFPKVAAPSVKKQTMSFAECVPSVKELVGSMQAYVPSAIIADTSTMLMVKVWANDAEATFTCSASDNVLVVSSAKYL